MSAEFRRQEIKARRLEIAAILATWRKDYFMHGVHRSIAERSVLEAEEANLAVELNQICYAVEMAKVERRKQVNAGLLNQLMIVLAERGLQDVITEAETRSVELIAPPEAA